MQPVSGLKANHFILVLHQICLSGPVGPMILEKSVKVLMRMLMHVWMLISVVIFYRSLFNLFCNSADVDMDADWSISAITYSKLSLLTIVSNI